MGSSVVLQAVTAADNVDERVPVTQASTGGDASRPEHVGPTFVLAGSLSPVTAAQVRATKGYVKHPLHAGLLLNDAAYRTAQVQHICDALGAQQHVLAYIDQQHGRDNAFKSADLAAATAQFVQSILQSLSEQGRRLGRLGIAGGDTSSQAIAQLDVWALSYSCVLSPGVTVCTMHSDDPALDGLTVMLKGGQMGSEDLFDKLLQVQGARQAVTF